MQEAEMTHVIAVSCGAGDCGSLSVPVQHGGTGYKCASGWREQLLVLDVTVCCFLGTLNFCKAHWSDSNAVPVVVQDCVAPVIQRMGFCLQLKLGAESLFRDLSAWFRLQSWWSMGAGCSWHFSRVGCWAF
mmetsp:Transcript_74097/g.197557  ORF Transcript_74097/g.197557 Transcript_74097/m.197557 type:complete len:131 (-) Transcript_74097:80-472(-)